MHPSNKPTIENLDALFTYHPTTPAQQAGYTAINNASKALALTILTHCPDCADRSAAIRQVREVRMTANAAIACDVPAEARGRMDAAQDICENAPYGSVGGDPANLRAPEWIEAKDASHYLDGYRQVIARR